MSDASRVNIFKYHEDRAWGKPRKNLPVTIVTGPLGAGKTTTLRHILHNKRNLRIAVAVNDFAAVNIDSDLISSDRRDAGVVELTNGCICCSKKGDLVDKVWTILRESDSGNVDYLVIETSGVTDPCTVVQTLEAEYGKMYRVRLDSVVLVLDADEVATRVADGAPPVHPNQLACADVILLNKCDLVSDAELDSAAAYLGGAVPGVVVHRCWFGSAPLDAILEVREANEDVAVGGAVTHETVERKLHVSAVDEKTLRTAKLADGVSGHAAHLSDDGVDSVVFESEAPFRLAAFQDALGPRFPGGIRRVKGWVFFDADPPGVQWQFHMSGRRRFECSLDRAHAVGQRKVLLVLIGPALDVQAIGAVLRSACVGVATGASGGGAGSSSAAAKAAPASAAQPAAPASASALPLAPPSALPDIGAAVAAAASAAEADRAVVAADERFDLADADGAPLTLFRLTATKSLQVTEEELSEKHGVDLNRVNTELRDRVNYATGAPFLTFAPGAAAGGKGAVWLRYAAGGEQRLADVWPAVSAAADVLMRDVFAHVYACRCGW